MADTADRSTTPPAAVGRRLLLATMLAATGGCAMFRGDSGDENAELNKLMSVPELPPRIGEAAVPRGLEPLKIDGVGLITGLPGTGGATEPSPFRDLLIDEIKRNDVADPDRVLETDDTAMVQVRCLVPPGARRGDNVDAILVSSPGTTAKNLRGGYLLKARLRQQKIIQGQVRRSDVMAIAGGPVLTEASYRPGSDAADVNGTILSGVQISVDRPLTLVIRPEFSHAKTSARIATVINDRFFFFDGSNRRGIAKAIEDDHLKVEVHPRYRENVPRMMSVIASIDPRGDARHVQPQLADCAARLKLPATAAAAALEMEALGETAIPTLIEALRSDNPELRFYAAEALAYLDQTEAIEPLVASILADASFRQPALSAAGTMQNVRVAERLRPLMAESSMEVRYGAFAAIRDRESDRGSLAGANVGGVLRFYRVASGSTPAVAVSVRRKPEVVVFGGPVAVDFQTPLRSVGGFVLRHENGQLRISRFQTGQPDQNVDVPADVRSLVGGIVGLGGGHGDVVATLRAAAAGGHLGDVPLAIDPLPEGGRTYHRVDGDENES